MNQLLLCRRAGVAAGALLAFAAACVAAEPAERVAAGVSLSTKGMILTRENPKADWQVVADKGELYTGDLVLGLPGSAVQTKDGAVRLSLLADFHSPLPVLEPAVVLHSAKDADLDFTLERGRVNITNAKESGSARVRIHVWGEPWEATLEGPGARLAAEVVGRWPPGTRFRRAPGTRDVPSAELLFLVLHGNVDLKHKGVTFGLTAPPGPALFGWNNLVGADAAPSRLDKLPDWAELPMDPAGKADLEKRIALRDRVAAGFAEHPIGEVLDHLVASDDPRARRSGVILMGALDELSRLGKTLNETTHPDTWDQAVVAMRHWLGRGPDQDKKLYEALTATKGYTPVQAETLIDLLHGFSEDDVLRPETYQLLINYLACDKLALRGLAHWRLVRMVPGGKDLPFDPKATPEARKEAQARWRKLVPPGELPKGIAPARQPGAEK
jgi:hypothetical protein